MASKRASNVSTTGVRSIRTKLALYSIRFATPKPMRAITLICYRKVAQISSCAPQFLCKGMWLT